LRSIRNPAATSAWCHGDFRHRDPIDACDHEPSRAIGLDPHRKRIQCAGERIRVRVAKTHQSAAAALDVEQRASVCQHHVRAKGPGGRAPRGGLGPGQGSPVRLCRIGRPEDEHVVVCPRFTHVAQALDGCGERELGSAEPLDKVAPSAHAEHLQVRELG